MKGKSRRLLSSLLAAALAFGLFAAMPLTASAAGPFQVTEHPIGASYTLNETAVPLRATFEYDAGAGLGTIEIGVPIRVQWYWSYTDSNTGRSNGFGFSTVAYNSKITYTTTLTPSTDTVGVKYYYAVLSYGVSVWSPDPRQGQGTWTTEAREAVTRPAKIEVIDSGQGFSVKKVDENGNPLAGAVIALDPIDAAQSYAMTTDSSGYVSFSAGEGHYILSEKQAPEGYNATDEKYYIYVGPDGVFIYIPGTNYFEPYELVTFVNKRIPRLEKDKHAAYMQGYPEGDFRPEGNMTRAEAVVMFSRLLAEEMDLSVDYRYDCYPDVDYLNSSMKLPWYANQVCYMHKLGVLADFSRDGNFRPNEPVTRAEFATLAAHFDDLVLTDTNIFTDVPDGHWAVKYINSAAARGWIIGYPDKTFKPEATITRAEVVTLVNRILERKADESYITANKSTLPRNYWDVASVSAHWAYWDIMEASIGHDYTKDGAGEHWTAVYP